MSVEDRLQYTFQNKELLQEALSHPSLSSEIRPAPADNQRLEFLGDAVLELVISNLLYRRYPDLQEGPLTKLRASLVSKPTLAEAARRVDLGAALRLSNGEEGSGGRERASNLADAFESVVGAIYLDSGLDEATRVIEELLAIELKQTDPAETHGNSKGELQEILQRKSKEAPQYRVLSEDGPPHNRSYTCAVEWQGQQLGIGAGSSKKTAEAAAAKAALARKGWE